jgi:hypothetical protein
MTTDNSRTGSTLATTSNIGSSGEVRIQVRISPVIEREFERRDIFPELRIERADHIINGATGVHPVSIARAREIFADAETQRRSRELRRGLSMAYSSLASNVAADIKQEERRGLFEDPGLEAARVTRLVMPGSPAQLEVGAQMLFFDGRSEFGHKVVVIKRYDLYALHVDTGPFIRLDGQRIEYRYGYRVDEGNQQYFAEPHQLTREDCKPSHLRLVASRPGSAAWSGEERRGPR